MADETEAVRVNYFRIVEPDAYDDMAAAVKRLAPSLARQMLASLRSQEVQARAEFQHLLERRLRLEGALLVAEEWVKGEG